MSNINKIGVIGASSMGIGIAQNLAQEAINVILIDVKDEFVEKGLSIIESTLQESVKREEISQEQKNNALGRITGSTYLQYAGYCDLVIETIIEDKKAKSNLFETLEEVCLKDTIIATNTSNYSINDLAKNISRPERFVGMHYFYHPAKNRLLEIIPAVETIKSTVDTCIEVAFLHGKTPIIVKDSPGFAINRFFVPSLNESCRMLEEGIANISTIEAAYKMAFGVDLGPFALMNIAGVSSTARNNSILAEELGPFYKTCDMLKNHARKNEYWTLEGEIETSKIETIVDRLYGLCIAIAAAMFDEGVATIKDIDIGAKLGLHWAKGPFELIAAIGLNRAYNIVEKITERHHGLKMPKIFETLKSNKKQIDLNYSHFKQEESCLN